nr:gamma-glutamylcyclotransferase [Pseudomonadota bacterium]
DRSGKCNLIATGRSGDRVIGVVYAMAAADKHRLDAAEGLGKGYTEARLAVGAAGAVHEVFLYLAQPAYIDDTLRPFAWYRQLVAEGARFHRLPDAYLSQILAVETLEDPDPRRAAQYAGLLDWLTRSGTNVL